VHGELDGLDADDHPQYLLLGGVRHSNSGFAVSGDYNASDPLPASGAGTRMVWYPARAALRAGKVDGGHWDPANLARFSVAFGENTTASANASVALGMSTTASGTAAMAVGWQSQASGIGAVAMGRSLASGNYSTAMGDQTEATNYAPTAMGASAKATGPYSTAMGTSTTASGSNSVAMGHATTAESYASVVIGRYNGLVGGNANSWAANDPLLVAGNGSDLSNRSNALVLYKNGNLQIAGTLSQSSDARLKEEIEPLEGVLDRALQLQPVTYRFREGVNRSRDRQIGLLAQEVAELFPELVKTEADGYLTLSYTQLTAVLIQALREQQERHEKELAAQAERASALESRIAELERLLARYAAASASEASTPERQAAGPNER